MRLKGRLIYSGKHVRVSFQFRICKITQVLLGHYLNFAFGIFGRPGNIHEFQFSIFQIRVLEHRSIQDRTKSIVIEVTWKVLPERQPNDSPAPFVESIAKRVYGGEHVPTEGEIDLIVCQEFGARWPKFFAITYYCLSCLKIEFAILYIRDALRIPKQILISDIKLEDVLGPLFAPNIIVRRCEETNLCEFLLN